MKEVPQWMYNETQRQTFCTWRDLKMGVKIMVKVRPVSKLDKCEVSDINIKYTLITLRSIYCVKRFPQADLDVDIFMDPPLGMGVNENRGKWVIN